MIFPNSFVPIEKQKRESIKREILTTTTTAAALVNTYTGATKREKGFL